MSSSLEFNVIENLSASPDARSDLTGCLQGLTSERKTMLAWVIRHGSLNMLNLIVSKADVKTRDRVSVTLALGLATRMRNIPAANILLSHGTRCDFEDAGIPVPADLDDPDGDTFQDPSDPRDFTPALVSAVLNRDVDIARMLLAHRANPNLGYHGVRSGMHGLIAFSCGRIVQLAMELRLFGMVQLLLEFGVDIGLAAPSCSEGGVSKSDGGAAENQVEKSGRVKELPQWSHTEY
ncbi:hypothetical protein N0V90_012854 [Kalmusia sp. IMI 367209]|nr:hypothetical protein N0V90_012854 [Kalmusia sp. IMI 367209]